MSRTDAIRLVYGRDISGNLCAFQCSSSDAETAGRIRVEGLLTGSGYTSAKRTKLLLFINGRCVSSQTLRRCVESVYGALLPKGVKPFVYLSITMPPDWVDVNVHPTKAEVAILHESVVCECVRSAVEKSLLTNEGARAIDMRVQTTLVPAETTAGIPDTGQTEHTQQTEEAKQAAPRSQASTRPDKLVRVDAQSRTLRELLSAPSRKNRRRSTATFDLGGKGTQDVHEGLREILKENVVIGWIDAERILVQKATKLYLLDVGELSRDLFVQRLGGPRDDGPRGRHT